MKTGELIIVWVAGLLSVAVLITLSIDDRFLRVYGIGVVLIPLIHRAALIASIWIVAGLIWATIYKRMV